ncbi:hypothetical protein [Microbispora sp. NPDC046933]|uniref:hypothetical protein n=1 Tax=Microbispora sp. NPDC046933 TaxID=3155618 RepID=UPI0034024469
MGDDQVRGVRRPLRLDRPMLHAEGRGDAPRRAGTTSAVPSRPEAAVVNGMPA